MQAVENLITTKIHSSPTGQTHFEKNKKNQNNELNSESIPENFLSMLQQNMKLGQTNTLWEGFKSLDSNLSLESAQLDAKEIYQPETTSHERVEHFRGDNFNSHTKVENKNHVEQNQEDQRGVQDDQSQKSEIGQSQKSEVDQVEADSDQGEENVKKSAESQNESSKTGDLDKEKQLSGGNLGEGLDKGRKFQAMSELLAKINKNSDSEAGDDKQILAEVKRKVKSQIRSDSNQQSDHKNGENEQKQNLSGQRKPHGLEFNPNTPEKTSQNFLSSKEVQNTNKENSSVRTEYNLPNTSAANERIKNSSFTKLAENPVFKNQMSEQFQSMMNRAKTIIKDQQNASLVTSLHPKELGTVGLRLSMLDGSLNGFFTVENDLVQKMLLERMDKMLSDLREEGYQVSEFQVNVRSDNSSSEGADTKNGRFKQGATFMEQLEKTIQVDSHANVKGELYA